MLWSSLFTCHSFSMTLFPCHTFSCGHAQLQNLKMGSFPAALPCRDTRLLAGAIHFKSTQLNKTLKWESEVLKVEKHWGLVRNVKAQMANPATYSSKISTDIPLYETQGASFDQYLEDKRRVFKAIFPDKRRSTQLNEEEWRVQMLPIEFLFLTVSPVIDMRLRCKTNGVGYPVGVPRDVSKVVALDIIRWELKGLDGMLKPSEFSLNVKGALYPDRRGPRARLKGLLQLSISFVLPPVLALIPDNVRREVAETVLKSLVETMKDRVNDSLIADYSEFKREKSRALA